MTDKLNGREVLQSKLIIPSLRQEFVYRPQTASLLNESLSRKLTIISAPAGFGKTSLVCEWLLGCPSKAVWLSLDAADNDPVRYWNHLLSALEQVAPEYLLSTRVWLQTVGLDMSESLMVPLLNELSMLKDPLVLVLDDFHMIKSEDIHQAMAYLIHYLPRSLQIILLTRDSVPLPLQRLKINQDLYEIGREQLCFKEEEIKQLFSILGAGILTETEMDELNQLTEGWVAVLCVIAAQACRTPGLKYLHAINPNLLQVFDYLYEELLLTMDNELQTFLLHTSIVSRMCPELCNELTRRNDSRTLLAQLERSNVFITLIEPSEQWYRYHLLFREFLHDQLKKQFPGEIRILHERAAKWFASKKLMKEAIEHSINGSNWNLAAEWLSENAPAFLQGNLVPKIENWLRQIPEKVFPLYPELWIVRSWTYVITGKSELALSDLKELSCKLSDVTVESPLRIRQLAVEMYLIEAHIATRAQNLEEAIHCARKTILLYPVVSNYFPVIFEVFINSELFIYRACGFRGRLSKSFRFYTAIREICEKVNNPRWQYYASSLAEIAYEQNLFHDALYYSDIGANLGYDRKMPSTFIRAMLVRIRVMKTIQSPDGFHTEWRRLEEGMQHIDTDAQWQDLILAFQVREALKEGTSSLVSEWEQVNRLAERNALSVAREYEYGTLIRVFLWQNKLAEAEKLIRSFRALMAVEDRFANLLELDLLQAVLFCKKGNVRQALAILDKTIALAAPEGFIRLFLDEGHNVIHLLFKLAKHPRAIQSPNTSYLQLLLDAAQEYSLIQENKQPTNEMLPEALTQRELDILNCISRGMTNFQIGERLGLSEGTVKVYNNQLYTKLGARNRTQAIKRAREAGIFL
jgi:LuxR family maltose regulon positive regulatory protein